MGNFAHSFASSLPMGAQLGIQAAAQERAAAGRRKGLLTEISSAIRSGDTDTAMTLIDVSGHIFDKDAQANLRTLAKSRSEQLRGAASRALDQAGFTNAPPELINSVARDQDQLSALLLEGARNRRAQGSVASLPGGGGTPTGVTPTPASPAGQAAPGLALRPEPPVELSPLDGASFDATRLPIMQPTVIENLPDRVMPEVALVAQDPTFVTEMSRDQKLALRRRLEQMTPAGASAPASSVRGPTASFTPQPEMRTLQQRLRAAERMKVATVGQPRVQAALSAEIDRLKTIVRPKNTHKMDGTLVHVNARGDVIGTQRIGPTGAQSRHDMRLALAMRAQGIQVPRKLAPGLSKTQLDEINAMERTAALGILKKFDIIDQGVQRDFEKNQ